jgi:hypothetical protein
MANAKERFQSGTLFQSTPRQKAEAQRTADRKKNRKLDVAAIMRQAGLQDTTIERRTNEPLSGIDITGPYETEFGKRVRKRSDSIAKLPVEDRPTNIRMANGGSTGKVQTSADTARKLASEMGGMKKGGKPKPKNGLAVMIAIGSPKKSNKKMMDGGEIPTDTRASKLMAAGGVKKPVKKMGGGMMYSHGGKPDKFAQGGAGKVRKGMMTPEGKIIDAMNKVRGK